MISAAGGKVYYTAYDRTLFVGTMGLLTPPTVQGAAVPVATFNSTEDCSTYLGAGTPAAVSTGSGLVTWTAATWTDVTPSAATDWTVYQSARVDAEPYAVLAAGSRLWVTDQTYDKLTRVTFGIAAPRVTIGHDAAGEVQLAWQAVGGAAVYRVWYSESPYFTVLGTPAQANGATTYVDPGAAASLTNHYYLVRAVDAGGAESPDSNRTGEFTYTLTKGSG